MSTSSSPGPEVRPLLLADGLPDCGPLAICPQRREVRHAAEPLRRAAIRQHEERKKRGENVHEVRAERFRPLIERPNAGRVIPSDIPHHLGVQRVLEPSCVDYAGIVVVPELPLLPVAATLAALGGSLFLAAFKVVSVASL